METSENQPQQPKPNASGIIFTIAIIAIFGMMFFGGGFEKLANKNLKSIQLESAEKTKAEFYAISEKDLTDKYLRAALVAEFYLQAGDYTNYDYWKSVEKDYRKKAGL